VRTVFVYGTLMPGRLRWPLIADRVVAHRPATVRGTLLDTGYGYPALVLPGPAIVHGWLLELDPEQAQDTLALLDEIEGSGYDRVEVRAEAGSDGGAPALTYVARGATAGFEPIPSGRWTSVAER
jgi:gamma-glutamylcyclotransferase (GGCT)/AIG2-like uncharacterized protein YtfP